MEITITRHQEIKETINIELPHYFSIIDDVEGGYVYTYGKIFQRFRNIPDVNVIVRREDYHGEIEYEIESVSLLAHYAHPENNSNELEWNLEKEKCIEFIKNL